MLSGIHDDKSDVCYASRTALRESEHYYTQSVLEGVVIGSATGAASGALVAASTGNDIAAGAAVGAVGGAIAGGIGGYYFAKQATISDQQALAEAVKNDILKENGAIDRTAIAFSQVRDCRFSAAERLKSDYQAKRIAHDNALKQLDELRRQFDEDVRIAQTLGMKMGERLSEFTYAKDQMLEKDPGAASALTASKTVAPPPVKAEPAQEPRPCRKSKSRKSCRPSAAKPAKPDLDALALAAAARPAGAALPPAAEVANITETNQIKQKNFVDQVGKAQNDARVVFSLEGSVSFTMPGTLLCER